LFKPKFFIRTVILVAATCVLLSLSPVTLVKAQLRTPIPGPGFDIKLFAGPADVEDWSRSGPDGAYSGPTSLAFDSRGRLFVGTLAGRILIMLDNNDDGVVDQVKQFASGLGNVLGIEFRSDGDLYITSNLTIDVGGTGRIIRLRDTNGDDVADEQTIVVDNLPSQGDHQTDRLKFGPDGRLYFGQGSATDAGTPDPGRPAEGTLNATIISIDPDNPQLNIVATGLRNPFGMAFHPETGELFATDGGSGELGDLPDLAPPEEVNWIIPGGNYGFPLCEGTPTADRPGCVGVRAPAIQYPPHLTPTALAFYTGPQAGEFRNQLLLALYKNLPNAENFGGDLRRVIVEGNHQSGFTLRDAGPDGFIVQLDPIDPFDGPIDVAIDPISGDIYLARIDPVSHFNQSEHHHFIYRIHRRTETENSDNIPFIGPPHPSAVKAGSGQLTISMVGKHLKPGAVVFNVTDGLQLSTRQGSTIFDLLADLPASMLATERSIVLEVRNPDGSRSNQQAFAITKGDPGEGDEAPQIQSVFVYKKKRSKIVDPLFAGAAPKKLRLVVGGSKFSDGAQVTVNGTSIRLDTISSTEIVGRFTASMVATPGDLSIRVQNSNGKLSNIVKITVVP